MGRAARRITRRRQAPGAAPADAPNRYARGAQPHGNDFDEVTARRYTGRLSRAAQGAGAVGAGVLRSRYGHEAAADDGPAERDEAGAAEAHLSRASALLDAAFPWRGGQLRRRVR